MDLQRKHVAITGASSGIGEALARELARAGARLSLIARREDLLTRIAREIGGDTFVKVHDLSVPERATEWIASAEEEFGPIDVLINNAGIQVIGRMGQIDPEKIEMMLRLNLFTPLRLTQAVLPGMIARGQGAIVDIASMAAIAPTPYMNAYNASKAGLASQSESLRGELLGTGVEVVTVYPGPIDTDLGRAGYQAYEPGFSTRVTPTGKADRLAVLIRRAIERKRARIIYPWIYSITRYFPNTTRFVLDRMTPKPRAQKTETREA